MKTQNKIILSKVEGIIQGIACTMDLDSPIREVLKSVVECIAYLIQNESKNDTEE